jgi:DNA-binding transcriptional LysR family regulator
MTKKINWERQNLKLRDLHVFCTVAQCGSMGKAAAQLGVAQPTVSEAIAGLEHAFGVRLLDRNPQGVTPTIYGHAVLRRSLAVFDELKQSSRDIESLSDPRSGEVRIASAESITATFLSLAIQHFSERFPRVVLHVDDVPARVDELAGLRDRRYDLVLLRLQAPITDDIVLEDENVEVLFDDELVIVGGAFSRWARRRKIDLSELTKEPWILMSAATWNYKRVVEIFEAHGLKTPSVTLVTNSVHLRMNLPSHGSFITAVPRSLLLMDGVADKLKVLPIDLPIRPWPVAIVTLRNRMLSSAAESFIASIREVAKSISKRSRC